MEDIEEIELTINNGDDALLDQVATRRYLRAIARTQVLILKELRLKR